MLKAIQFDEVHDSEVRQEVHQAGPQDHFHSVGALAYAKPIRLAWQGFGSSFPHQKTLKLRKIVEY